MATQMDHLKAHLRDGKSISPLEALGLYGIFRLAARVKELRNKGWEIDTDMRTDRTGKTHARYTLTNEPGIPVLMYGEGVEGNLSGLLNECRGE